MSKRYTYEQIKETFKEKGYELLSKKYLGSQVKMVCRDEDGYLFYIPVDTVRYKGKSNYIDIANPYTIRNIKRYIKIHSIGVELLTKEYVGNKHKMEWRCICGETFLKDWCHFSTQDATRCNNCALQKRSDVRKLPIDMINQLFIDKNYIPKFDTYINSHSKLYFEDYEGYKYSMSYDSFKIDKQPMKFSPSNEFTLDNIKQYIRINKLNCEYLSGDYVDNTNLLKFKCVCGNEFDTNWASLSSKNKAHCDECGKLKYIESRRKLDIYNHFSDSRFYPCDCCDEEDIKKCVDCDVYNHFKRNKCDLVEGWSSNEYISVIKGVYNNEIKSLNDILAFLNGKSLEDLINLTLTELKIGGDKELQIKSQCAYCNKEILRPRRDYNKDKVYCDMECRNKMKSEYYIGENSPSYRSVKQLCTNCEKEIIVRPYKNKELNSFGENHTFCSHECYSEYRSKYYIGDKWTAERTWTDEQKETSRDRMIYMLSNGMIPTKMTKPHIVIDEMLIEMNVSHQNEYPTKYYSIDLYLDEYDLMIEIMGDYFHGNPMMYEYYDDLNEHQQKGVIRDKRKHTYIKKYNDIEILYLWESQINNNPELCKLLIEEYIGNGGDLYDYNSYNYHIKDGILAINDIVYDPYFIDRSKIS